MGVRRKQRSTARRGGLAIGGGLMAVLVALACAVVLMLSGIIPVFGRSKTVDRTQTPVLQRIEKLNKFKAATGTFQPESTVLVGVGGSAYPQKVPPELEE